MATESSALAFGGPTTSSSGEHELCGQLLVIDHLRNCRGFNRLLSCLNLVDVDLLSFSLLLPQELPTTKSTTMRAVAIVLALAAGSNAFMMPAR